MTEAANGTGPAAGDAARVEERPEGLPAPVRRVRFDSIRPYLLEDVTKAPRSEAAGTLYLPEGEAEERPGVVVVQGLGGPKPEREDVYGAKLAKAGYAALVLDSFEPRGLGGASDKRKALQITTWALLADAFAAMRFLGDQPGVRRDAIGVIGFSWGGMVALVSAFEQIRRAFLREDEPGFAAHASYYGCSIPRMDDSTTTGAPVMVLIGRHDANVSVERTRQICEDLRRGGSEVTFREFDALHQWDGIDTETRHVTGSLADIRIRIGRDNVLRLEDGPAVRGVASRIWGLLSRLRWRGYDIRRDSDLHRRTDAMLLAFLAEASRRRGVPPTPDGPVPLGSTDAPV